MKTMARSLRTALPPQGWLVLGALCVLAVVLALVTNAQYGPDSRIYLAWTYWYLGHPQAEAAQLSYDYLRDDPGLATCLTCWPADFRESFFTGPYAAVVGPRVLLPVLSAPFVALFGPAGMLVVPIVGYALTILATVLLASRLWGPRWALVAGAMLLLPVYVSRWSVVAHTEGPAFALLALPLLVLPLARRVGRKQLVVYVALVFLGMLNRQFAIALPAAVAAAWLLVAVRDRAFRNPWLPFAIWGNVVAFVVLAAQMVITPMIFGGEDLSLLESLDELTLKYFGTSGIAAIPEVTWNIVRSDLLAVRYDLALVALLAASAVAVVWRFRSELSALAAGAFFVVSAFNVIEFWPAAFRYHAPIVPLLVLAVVALMVDLWGPIRRRPSRSTEAGPREPIALEQDVRRIGRMPTHAWVTVVSLAALVPVVLSYRIWHFYSASTYHLGWSYRALGFSPDEAAIRTRAELYDKPFAATFCGRDSCFGVGSDWLFGHATSADPNLVYPVLSAPFVALLGDKGLIVVPVLSFFAAVGLLTWFAVARWGALVGTVTAVVFLVCDQIVASSLTGTADMLALALGCALLFTLPLDGRRGRRALVAFAVLTALLLAGRAPAMAFVAAVVTVWAVTAVRKRSVRNAWLPYSAVASGLAVGLVALGQVATIADARYLGSLGKGLGALLRIDGTYLAEDAVLCSVLVLAVAGSSLRALRDPMAALALGGIVAAVLLEVASGTPSGARAFSPVFPLILLSAMGTLVRLFDGLSPWNIPVPDEPDEALATVPEPVPAA
ncbi:hypothetical protein [Cryptosporangium japonicum]|uniref:Glycosyltransferase RgtA/B/C/D-like domain-containing protein n=1 Tax=Cryptosporangium japonicum TaxID=80872 RepID=A0ABN0TWQ1_9ACTN